MNQNSIPIYNNDISFPSRYSENNRVTLFNGDCEDFLVTLPDESIQLIVTSPPYNIGKEYEEILPFKEYLEWQDAIIDLSVSKLQQSGSICWQVGNYVEKNNKNEIYPLDIFLYDSFKRRGLKLRNRIIWHYGHGLHSRNRFSGRYETIMWFTKSDEYTFNLDPVRTQQKYPGKKSYSGKNAGNYSGNPLGKNPSDVWDIPNVKSNHVEKTIHPCQFPVSLINRLVLSMSNEGDLIFDPFMGVGSTQISAVINNRRTAGSEVSNEYFSVATNRILEAIHGTIKIREDKPVYSPPPGTPLTTNPFTK